MRRCLTSLLFLIHVPVMAACPPLLDRSVESIDERPRSLCEFAGSVVLIVNTASQCGYTPQYEGLEDQEILDLNRIVTMYLDYAQTQAERRRPLYMKDWREKLDAFLKFNERRILEHAGQISMEVAKKLALEQYERFERKRLAQEAALPDDDFDQAAKRLEHQSVKHAKRKKK